MEATDRLTLDQFLSAYAIDMHVHQTHSNPTMDDSFGMTHWYCTLIYKRERMSVNFSKGQAYKGAKPTVAEVLDCLASDAASYENTISFEDWADEFGYSRDSRKAEKVYHAVGRQRDNLFRLLGETAYATLLWQVDRA